MKKNLVIILILLLFPLILGIILFDKEPRILMCTKEDWPVGGKLIEEIRFYETDSKMKTKNVFYGNEDYLVDRYFEYIDNIKECSDLKRNDNVLDYLCEYEIKKQDYYEKVKSTDGNIDFDLIKKYFEEEDYTCDFEVIK